MGRKIHDLSGMVLGKLTVIDRVPGKPGKVQWRCQCSCGNETVKAAGALRRGDRSCGCLLKAPASERARYPKVPVKQNHQAVPPAEYQAWSDMHSRCKNPKNRKYPLYGARGVRVCARWALIENFLADMGPRPPGTSLDRIDNDGHYEPNNCRWATYDLQQWNRRITRAVPLDGGKRVPARLFSRLYRIPYSTLCYHLNRGLTGPEILDKRHTP